MGIEFYEQCRKVGLDLENPNANEVSFMVETCSFSLNGNLFLFFFAFICVWLQDFYERLFLRNFILHAILFGLSNRVSKPEFLVLHGNEKSLQLTAIYCIFCWTIWWGN